MIHFILNNEDIRTDLHAGTTVLDFVRYRKNLKGTKIGCREGDCGACTILVGELKNSRVSYRTMTSCLMPLANASGKHIVTVEGINPADGSLTPVQKAMIDESGTQCGFCTVGFVMSLTGFCIDEAPKTCETAVSSIDGNICRCTGYKSIERAAAFLSRQSADGGKQFVPEYFDGVPSRLGRMRDEPAQTETGAVASVLSIVAGGTDVYVQKPDSLPETESSHVFSDETLRAIEDGESFIEIGASTTVTDLLESSAMQSIFPDLYKHLKLVSSTPIRNMATLAGNFVNASPIGDMTVWFLALDADIVFNNGREMPLRNLYIDYKRLAKTDNEFIKTIRFKKPVDTFYFNFEKVCKRTYLDIASVNTAISLTVESTPGPGWVPPALKDQGSIRDSSFTPPHPPSPKVEHVIIDAHVSAGGVAPIPLYLKETSKFLHGQPVTAQTIADANEIIQAEVSPISDVRGSADYKRLLLRQLFRAHFVEMFDGPRN
ncbi:MAG TPA: FAD binding domain-containing protein [Pyrinomonadaceae bacterium]|nr:FAD binding domain-containing protein [Pyrinomonadaceae bacterium]